MPVDKIENVGAMVNGSGNQIATGNGRIGSHDIHHAQGVQIGDGNRFNGSLQLVDYSTTLPTIELWASHFRGSGHAEIAKRLDELERLMKAGTPTPQAKSRLRELSEQLTQLLSGAADATQLFSTVARAAGFAG